MQLQINVSLLLSAVGGGISVFVHLSDIYKLQGKCVLSALSQVYKLLYIHS